MSGKRQSKNTTGKRLPTVPAQVAGPDNGNALDLGPSRAMIRDRVLKYVESHPGVTVYCDDIARDLDANRSSVQSAVRGLQERVPQISTVISGKAWRWDANAKAANPGKRMFEELTTTRAGVILVQDEDGNVYKLEEL